MGYPNDNQKSWLEQKRIQLGAAGRVFTGEGVTRLLSEIPETEREAAQIVWEGRIGKTVAELQDEQVQNYAMKMFSVLPEKEREVAEKCLFCVMPTQDFNAYAGFTSQGDRVIVLHWGLCNIYSFWAHWYSSCMEAGYNVLNSPQKTSSALQQYLALWKNLQDTAYTSEIYPKTSHGWEHSEHLSYGCMQFVLGHELGHVALEHSGYSRINTKLNHNMEFEADRKGLDVCVGLWAYHAKSKHSEYAENYLIAPLFAIAVMSLNGDSSSNTHPSPSKRIEAANSYVFEKISQFNDSENAKKSVKELLLPIFGEASQIMEIFHGYRQSLTPIMAKNSETNIRLSHSDIFESAS